MQVARQALASLRHGFAGQANVMWTPLARRAKEDGRGRSKVKDL